MASFILPITEVLVVAECWQAEPEAEAIIQRAIAAAAGIADADVGEAELAVMLTDDAGIRTLNSNWRGIDKPTNVLSFEALQPTGGSGPDEAPRMLGDIAIAAAAGIADAGVGEAELAVMLTDDAGIRTLNSNWRGIDKPTNVLSFEALQPTGGSGPDEAPRMLGDIAIAYQTTRQEADDEQKPFDHHLSHLAVHGFLHLIGYDHEKDDDAEAMEALEQEILAQLGIPDPYADRERMD